MKKSKGLQKTKSAVQSMLKKIGKSTTTSVSIGPKGSKKKKGR